MNNLARTIVDLYFELNFVDEEYVEFDWSLHRCAEIRMAIENEYTSDEQAGIRAAASEKLKELLRDPDEDGYTPRSLVSEEQKQFLVAISEGRYDGAPADTR